MRVVMFVGVVPQDPIQILQMLNYFWVCIEHVLVSPRCDGTRESSLVIHRNRFADFDPVRFTYDLVIFTKTRRHVNDPGSFGGVHKIGC